MSEHYEELVISQIKLNCGATHTREIETMLGDIKVSAELEAQFAADNAVALGGQQGSSVPLVLSFKILSERVWPSYRREDPVLMPRELTLCLDQIAAFYDGCRCGGGRGHGGGNGGVDGGGGGGGASRLGPAGQRGDGSAGRQSSVSATQLTWLAAHGRGELQPRYGKFGSAEGGGKARPLRLDCSIYQAAILLLFNELPAGDAFTKGLTMREIATALHMELAVCRRYVISLCLGKYKALRKSDEAQKKTVGDDETLRPNLKLHTDIVDKRSKRPKAKISFPVPKREAARQRKEEDEVVDLAVQEERKYAIEAAVVRQMKMQRTLKMQQLIASVVSQLSGLFQPDPRYIKRRVADLIDREFMARDDDDPNTLHYIA